MTANMQHDLHVNPEINADASPWALIAVYVKQSGSDLPSVMLHLLIG